MADLLDWEEWEVIDFISVYAKWFNSPSSGKYLLYHERLRVFFLQKISSHQLNQTNQSIISKCQLALEQRNGDEWEVYALEHHPSHLLVAAMQSEADGVVFKKLVYDNSFWNRQIEISKGYEWSKRMLNQAMTWAAKQNTDELIECALNKIDLHHMEQNDAPRIVELVVQNDIETALQRIESFGGNDKEGLQRKFILYMLCLMELTLLDSKDKPFRRDAIEKILKHFDENMPIDHSVLNWGDFFSSYLLFSIVFRIMELGLDAMLLFARAEKWDLNWIDDMEVLSDNEINIIKSAKDYLVNDFEIDLTLNKLISVYLKKDKFDSAIEIVDKLSNEDLKATSSVEIAMFLAEKNDLDAAIQHAESIVNDYYKCVAYVKMAFKVYGKKNLTVFFQLLNYSLELAGASNAIRMKHVFVEICTCWARFGELEKALQVAGNIKYSDFDSDGREIYTHRNMAYKVIVTEFIKLNDKINIDKIISQIDSIFFQCKTYVNIANVLVDKGLFKKAEEILCTALSQAENDLKNAYGQGELIEEIALIYAKSGNFLKALNIAEELIAVESVSIFKNIASIAARKGDIELVIEIMERGQSFKLIDLCYFSQDFGTRIHWHQFSLVLINSIEFKHKKNENYWHESPMYKLFLAFVEKGDVENSIFLLNKAIEENRLAVLERNFYFGYLEIIDFFLKKNDITNAIGIVEKIKDSGYKETAIELISIRMSKNGDFNEAIQLANRIESEYMKRRLVSKISIEMASQGYLENAYQLLDEFEDDNKYSVLCKIYVELAKNGFFEQAIKLLSNLDQGYEKNKSLKDIVSELVKSGQISKAEIIADEITLSEFKSQALILIANYFIANGQFESFNRVVEKIYREPTINESSLSEMAILFSEYDHFEKSYEILDNLNVLKNLTYQKIAKRLAMKYEFEKSIGFITMITNRKEQLETYLEIGKEFNCEFDMEKIKVFINYLPNDSAVAHFEKGLLNSISMFKLSRDIFLRLLPFIKTEFNLFQLLNVYALHCLFFDQISPESLTQFNRTLNIQWAIDISNNFNKI
jgi:tetratricopeptide (TPR) repeat protein